MMHTRRLAFPTHFLITTMSGFQVMSANFGMFALPAV